MYLKVVAGLLPKDINMKVQHLEDLTDEQLLRKLNALTEMARPLLAKVIDAPAGVDGRVAEPVDVEYVDSTKG